MLDHCSIMHKGPLALLRTCSSSYPSRRSRPLVPLIHPGGLSIGFFLCLTRQRPHTGRSHTRSRSRTKIREGRLCRSVDARQRPRIDLCRELSSAYLYLHRFVTRSPLSGRVPAHPPTYIRRRTPGCAEDRIRQTFPAFPRRVCSFAPRRQHHRRWAVQFRIRAEPLELCESI